MFARFVRSSWAVVLLVAACRESPPLDVPPRWEPAGPISIVELGDASVPWQGHPYGATIDFGTPAAHPFLERGWGRDERLEDGTTFVWSEGDVSVLRFDVPMPYARRLYARVWPYQPPGAPHQVVEVALNGRSLGRWRLRPGLRTLDMAVPAAAQVRGPNRLELRYPRRSAVLEQVPPGEGLDTRQLAVAWVDFTFGDVAPGVGSAPRVGAGKVTLPFGSRISFFLRPFAGSGLRWEGVGPAGTRGRLYIETESEGEPVRSFRIAAGESIATLPLDVVPGRLTRITLTAETRNGKPRDGALVIERPQLVGTVRDADAAPPAMPEDAGASADTTGQAARNVVIYLVDTLRADRLGSYGYPRPTSPDIDRFASDAILFPNTMAASSWTRSSVASVLTGLSPVQHGTHGRDDALAGRAVTLAERLAEVGYATSAFVTNGNVGAPFGFAQGFDRFDLLGGGDHHALHTSAEQVNEAVFAWLDGRSPDRPFFLYVHTMEPHAPYVPPPVDHAALAPGVELTPMPEGVRSEMVARGLVGDGEVPVLGSVPWVQALSDGLLNTDSGRRPALEALYDAEVRAADRAFGAFVDGLRARGLLDRTLIVLVSDHGEEFDDHGGWSHGHTLYQEQLGVMMIVRDPRSAKDRGRRDARLATHVDVAPTVLDFVGLPVTFGQRGQSLLAAPSASVVGYAHLALDGHRGDALIDGRWKLVCFPCRLFDLDADPGETEDVSARHALRAAYLEARLRALAAPPGSLTAEPASIDPELDRRLRALGYQ